MERRDPRVFLRANLCCPVCDVNFIYGEVVALATHVEEDPNHEEYGRVQYLMVHEHHLN